MPCSAPSGWRPAPPRRPIVEYLIDSLDEHGLLDRSLRAARRRAGCRRAGRRCESWRSSAAAGRPAIGATSVAECLLLQLDALGLADDRARLARAVIADHLPALARGHFASIATALGSVTRPGPAGPRADPAAAAAVSGLRRQRADGLLVRRPGRGGARGRRDRRCLHRRPGRTRPDAAGCPSRTAADGQRRLGGRRRGGVGAAGQIVPRPAARPLGDPAAGRRVHGPAAAGVPGRRAGGVEAADPRRGRPPRSTCTSRR